MKTFLVCDSNKIVNAIIAENKEIAMSSTNMKIIEFDESNPIWIGWELYDNEWRPPQPYPSWHWNEELKQWDSPIPIPEISGSYYWQWNEESGKWEKEMYPPPYPSWILDEDENWQPPVPLPESENSYYWDEDSQSWILIEE